MTDITTPVFTEGWGPYHAYVGATLEVELGDDYYVFASIEDDNSERKPWDDDGHGDVTDWVSRSKAPGELLVSWDRAGAKRFYDYAGACAKALAEGWGPALEGETKRQAAARCAREDYEVMRKWCADQWFYCGIAVWVELNGRVIGGNKYNHALWGVEYNYPRSDNDYLLEVANELAPEAIERAYALAAEENLCDT